MILFFASKSKSGYLQGVKKILVIGLLLWSCVQAMGQMTIHPGDVPPLQPDNIIENVFLGNGVTLLNTQYSGFDSSVGIFDNAESSIGLEKGIVLTTGHARNVNQPNSVDQLNGNTSNNSIVDEELNALAGVNVLDIAKFEIEFIPSSDLLSFRYVFASEEYPKYVCLGHNDVFGFFITGPKPGGGFYNNENIARVPDSNRPGEFLDLPVTVNSVNNGSPGTFADGGLCDGNNESLSYAEYYNENPLNSVPAFNGFLDIFIAQAEVIPCETYTIEIAIGDGGDRIIDSAVFLEGRSFSTKDLIVDINNPGIEGGIAEDCASGSINISIVEPLTTDLPVELKILTDDNLVNPATEGVDFATLPTNVNILAGTTTVNVPLVPFADNLAEGTEFIYLGLRRNICTVDTFILPLYDNVLTDIVLVDTLVICSDETFTLSADLGEINTADNLEFVSTESVDILTTADATESTIIVSGLKDIALNPSIISEICIDDLQHNQLKDLDIFLQAPSGQILELSSDNDNFGTGTGLIQTCFTATATQVINGGNPSESAGIPGNPNYTGNFLPEGSFDDWLSPITSELNGPYTLYIVDDTKAYNGQLRGWHLTINPKYELAYNWAPSIGLDCPTCDTTSGEIRNSQYYYLNLVDSYGCTYVDSTWIQVYEREEAPVVVCNQSAEGQIEINWPNSGSSFEFMVVGKNRWYSTATSGSLVAGIYTVDILAENQITVSGMLANEPVTVMVRAVNAAGCNSPAASTTCTAIPCTTTLPELISVEIDQPECSSQSSARVIVNAEGISDLQYIIKLGNNSAFNSDGFFRSIPPGTWPLRISDTNGCAIEQMITVNAPPAFALQSTVQQITCRDDNDARIELEITGDNPPFTTQWATGSDLSIQTNLENGLYEVTVTDNLGCTLNETFEIINPVELVSTYIQSDVLNCNGENPEAFASVFSFGGKAPYATIWNGSISSDTLYNLSAGTLQWQVTDSLGCIVTGSDAVEQSQGLILDFENVTDLPCFNTSTGQATVLVDNGSRDYVYLWSSGETNATASALAAGQNSVTVTDSDGCIATADITIQAPAEIHIIPTVSQPNCAVAEDGQIDLGLSGGTGDLQIIWDNNSTNISLSDLSAGTYCVTITDSNFCTESECFDLQAQNPIQISSDISKVSCNPGTDGAISVQPSGGSGKYEYLWNGPNGYTSQNKDIVGLDAGSYSLIVTDANNRQCQSVTFEFALAINTDLTTTLELTDAFTCVNDPNGRLDLIVEGGESPYTYLWSDGSVENNLMGLSQGVYSVTVTDANDCTSVSQMTITDDRILQNQVTKQDLMCAGTEDGFITLLTTGGNEPYQYEWNVPGIEPTINNLSAGQYSVTVTDAVGCTVIEAIELTEQFQSLEINPIVENEKCYQNEDGSISIEIISGEEPIMFGLDDGAMQSSNTFNNLESGTYQLSIMDANGCIEKSVFTVLPAQEISLEIVGDLLVEFGGSVELSVQMFNAEGDINYNWNAPQIELFSCSDCNNPVIENITKSFSAQLTVVDENGCNKEAYININVVDDMNLEVPTGFTPNGDGVNDILSIYGNPGFSIINFTLYNRYGQKVYEGYDLTPNQESQGWDGRFQGELLPSGSYVWTIEYQNLKGEKGSTRGVTTLIK
jgi:gliding motility-associated-like protein